MNKLPIPFATINWSLLLEIEHKGETGAAYWKTIHLPGLRIREVTYSPDYKADHWCEKGHIIYCIEGEMITELANGQTYVLKKGMSYHVSDNMSVHKSSSISGVRLFIIDGDFLK